MTQIYDAPRELATQDRVYTLDERIDRLADNMRALDVLSQAAADELLGMPSSSVDVDLRLLEKQYDSPVARLGIIAVSNSLPRDVQHQLVLLQEDPILLEAHGSHQGQTVKVKSLDPTKARIKKFENYEDESYLVFRKHLLRTSKTGQINRVSLDAQTGGVIDLKKSRAFAPVFRAEPLIDRGNGYERLFDTSY